MPDDLALIPEDLRDIYKWLEDEISEFHFYWKMYRQVAGTNEDRIELLNEIAPSFFGAVQNIWIDTTIIHVCRMTDPPKQGPWKNVVVRLLYDELDKDEHKTLAATLERGLQEIERTCSPLRVHRNRRIAHLDSATNLRPDDNILPGVSRQTIEDALAAIRDYVNAFRVHFLKSPLYFQGIMSHDDGDTLIHSLKQAYEYRKLEKEDWHFRVRVRDGKYGKA